ncbi:MAG: hypothetical protein AAGG48_31995, partial [Planctomycetota bacterium]
QVASEGEVARKRIRIERFILIERHVRDIWNSHALPSSDGVERGRRRTVAVTGDGVWIVHVKLPDAVLRWTAWLSVIWVKWVSILPS